MSSDAGPTAMPRPAPALTEDNAIFWDAADEGRLVVQECTACGRRQHPPRPMCPQCRSTELVAKDSTGTGTVYSYSLLHHPQHPAFAYPVVAVLVDLDDGPRVLSAMPSVDSSAVRIGLRVRAAFVDTDRGGQIPVFELDEAAA